jgi:hypothetical protein
MSAAAAAAAQESQIKSPSRKKYALVAENPAALLIATIALAVTRSGLSSLLFWQLDRRTEIYTLRWRLLSIGIGGPLGVLC